jgi:hypothetical protein
MAGCHTLLRCVCGILFSARNFCAFCGFCGRISKRAAWVWQGCHTLLNTNKDYK